MSGMIQEKNRDQALGSTKRWMTTWRLHVTFYRSSTYVCAFVGVVLLEHKHEVPSRNDTARETDEPYHNKRCFKLCSSLVVRNDGCCTSKKEVL